MRIWYSASEKSSEWLKFCLILFIYLIFLKHATKVYEAENIIPNGFFNFLYNE